jgi:hypothetical protein
MDAGEHLRLVGHSKQFGRYAFGFTPACGSEVECFARVIVPGAMPQAGMIRALGAEGCVGG